MPATCQDAGTPGMLWGHGTCCRETGQGHAVGTQDTLQGHNGGTQDMAQ